MSLGMVRKAFDGSAVVSAVTTYSDIFRLDEGSDWGIYLKNSVGTMSVSAILQVSPNRTLDNFIAPDGYASITAISGSAAHMANITQYNMMYGRIGMAGGTATPSGTVTAYIFNREDCY